MQKLCSLLTKYSVKYLLIPSLINCRYLTQINNDFSFIIISKDKNYYLTDSRTSNEARAKLNEFEVIEVNSFNYIATIKSYIKDKKIGLDTYNCYYNELTNLINSLNNEFIDISEDLINIRSQKNNIELDLLNKAIEISDIALAKTIPYIKEDITELELASELESQMLKNGADGIAFETIMAFGKNSAQPHWKKSNTKLKNNDVILMDFGAKLNGYHSDITRTYVFGKGGEEFKNIYDITLNANLRAKEVIKSGLKCEDIDSVARDYIDKNGYKEYFLHSLGHGVGLEIHEFPRLGQRNNKILKENMTVTIEPGIYINNKYGVRIEDVVLIGKENSTTLTKSSRKYIEI